MCWCFFLFRSRFFATTFENASRFLLRCYGTVRRVRAYTSKAAQETWLLLVEIMYSIAGIAIFDATTSRLSILSLESAHNKRIRWNVANVAHY